MCVPSALPRWRGRMASSRAGGSLTHLKSALRTMLEAIRARRLPTRCRRTDCPSTTKGRQTSVRRRWARSCRCTPHAVHNQVVIAVFGVEVGRAQGRHAAGVGGGGRERGGPRPGGGARAGEWGLVRAFRSPSRFEGSLFSYFSPFAFVRPTTMRRSSLV